MVALTRFAAGGAAALVSSKRDVVVPRPAPLLARAHQKREADPLLTARGPHHTVAQRVKVASRQEAEEIARVHLRQRASRSIAMTDVKFTREAELASGVRRLNKKTKERLAETNMARVSLYSQYSSGPPS